MMVQKADSKNAKNEKKQPGCFPQAFFIFSTSFEDAIQLVELGNSVKQKFENEKQKNNLFKWNSERFMNVPSQNSEIIRNVFGFSRISVPAY